MANAMKGATEKGEVSPASAPPSSQRHNKRQRAEQTFSEPEYSPPDFSGSRQIRIGSSYIEQFVAGHDASAVLRELVQNEFDGGGETLSLVLGSHALEVTGSGRAIDRGGWDRLSVIVGTGNVMGSRHAEVVAPKENGIGSKNFGLRSLFRFGDEIHVRSGGQVALLDLQTQETARERDPDWRGTKGVRLYVPYRQASTERLEAFTPEREAHALDLMAAGMTDTLVKLSLGGKRRGLRAVTIRSIRTGRAIEWRQDAKPVHCRAAGVTIIARKGRLSIGDEKPRVFQEEEFTRAVELPAEFAQRAFPAYFRLPSARIKIAVSLPITRRRVDLSQSGHFYYPLKAAASPTGCVVNVSAPFELNTDRSAITDHSWNDWLIDQAVDLTVSLLKSDWFDRYGSDAYRALIEKGSAKPDRFLTKLQEQLETEDCWPSLAKSKDRFVSPVKLVVPVDPALKAFLPDERYLDPALEGDQPILAFLTASGAKRFTLSSLVRLRCGDKEGKGLATKLGDAASFYYPDYSTKMADIRVQKATAAALSSLSRHLSNQNRDDLANSESTLTATGELRPASELILVAADLWEDCPEPKANRLHPELAEYRAIASHCTPFDEEQWLIDAAVRAASAAPDDRERDTLYRKLLARQTPFSRRAIGVLRSNPVVKNRRGEWVAPENLVDLKGSLARMLAPVLDLPSNDLAKTSAIERLKIRDTLSGADLTRVARSIAGQPQLAAAFEKLLAENSRLLTAPTVAAMSDIAFLPTRSGELGTPSELHFDTAANRLCISDDRLIVSGSNELLFRKLGLRPSPGSQTLLDVLLSFRTEHKAPPRPDLFYPALVDALQRERRLKEVADTPLCWVNGAYHSPSDILVGARLALPLAEAIPIHSHWDEVGRAYQALGAPALPGDEHWTRFFEHVGSEWAKEVPLDKARRRLLLEAYHIRGASGLPAGLDDSACLLDDRRRLFTPLELQDRLLVEPDFQPLEVALREADSIIGVIERTERSRVFFASLGISPLSAVAGSGEPILGDPGRPMIWFTPKFRDRVLALLHRPILADALSEVAYRSRHGLGGFAPHSRAEIAARLAAVADVTLHQRIDRRYNVGGASIMVPAQVAVEAVRLAFVTPKTKNVFQLLLAEALAEIAGARSVSAIRTVANAFLPLVLCATSEDLADYLERMGIPAGRLDQSPEDDMPSFDLSEDPDDDDAEEAALRQVFDSLDTGGATIADDVAPVEPAPIAPTPPLPPPAPPAPAPVPFSLPDLSKVLLTVASTKGTEMMRRAPQGGGSSGSSGYWLPPTPAEVERAGRIGQRGEELVYQMELERVREMGFAEPERYVIWTSRDEPGADHDIRSVDAEGRPRWLEVKSTTGTDGRFDWSRKEFEKAFRERERYELWRVYRAADTAPVAKCFPNPARLLGNGRIALELGTLRANIEDMSQ